MINQFDAAAAIDELSTCRDFLRWGESCLRRGGVFLGHGFEDPWDEVAQLLFFVLHLPADSDPRILDAKLLREERARLVTLLCRRVNERIPVAYLVNEAWFCGMPFAVNRQVLIPRSPIAELIEQGFSPWLNANPRRILDLCTGSGCIAIAMAWAFPMANVDASDLSTDALNVAQSNIARYQLEQSVRLYQGDGLAAVASELQSEGRYDLIVSNPPYVDAEDMANLPDEYRHEPAMALESGDDGLDFVRQLLSQAANYLTENGVLVVEVGNSAPALERAFPHLPFTWIEFERGGDGVFILTREQLTTQMSR